MTSRLLALVLAFTIGSPACWCCLPASEPAKTIYSCCEPDTPQHPQPANAPGEDDPCPCGLGMVKRELAKRNIDVAPPVFALILPVLEAHLVPAETFMAAAFPRHFDDTGPPRERTPIFLRQQALLL